MKSAIINPIKFYRQNEMPNYTSRFPNQENITSGQVWQYGVNYSPDAMRFHIDSLSIQMLFESGDTNEMKVYKLIDNAFSFIETITGSDISPAGWTTDPIYLYLADLDDGVYYLEFENELRSDIFTVTTSTRKTEDFVKIQYSNSENDFGCIFDDGSNLYTFISYFKGNLLPGQPSNEIDSYEDDRGEPVKLRATPQRTSQINVKGVSMLYVDYFIHLFSCDIILINDIDYENIEAPSIDAIEGSDLVNVSIKLIQKSNDYYNG